MPRLIVYAGPNGAGKSTIRDIAGDAVDVVIDPDRIARSLARDNPAGANFEAGKEAIRQFDRALILGRSISLETTLSGATILHRVIRAKTAGYHVSLFYVALISPDDNIARVAARVANGGHHIPSDTIRRRVAASLDNLPAALVVADTGKVYDNSGPTLSHLLTTVQGRSVFEAPVMPAWLNIRMDAIRAALG